MPLTECKSCGDQVDSSAQTCPHCGVKNPGGWFAYTGVGGGGCLKFIGCILGLVILGVMASVCFGLAAV